MAFALFPPLPVGATEGNTPAFAGSAVLDAADEAIGNVFSVPKSGNIRKIHTACRTTTTGATMEARVETLSAGFPSGTLWGTNTNGTLVVNNTDDNVILTFTLTADAAVVAGDTLAVIVKNPTVSFGNINFALAPADTDNTGLPYGVANTTGSYAAFSQNAPLVMALEYDDGTIVGIDAVNPPCTALTAITINTGTTPDVAGLRFQFVETVSCSGAWIWMDLDGDAKIQLVDTAWDGTDGDVLAMATVDSDNRNGTTPRIFRVRFPSVVLSPATPYRLVVNPTSVTSVALYDSTTSSSALMAAWATNFCTTTAKDPNDDTDWTNYNSGTFRQPYIGLVVEGFDIASGSPSGAAMSLLGGLVR